MLSAIVDIYCNWLYHAVFSYFSNGKNLFEHRILTASNSTWLIRAGSLENRTDFSSSLNIAKFYWEVIKREGKLRNDEKHTPFWYDIFCIWINCDLSQSPNVRFYDRFDIIPFSLLLPSYIDCMLVWSYSVSKHKKITDDFFYERLIISRFCYNLRPSFAFCGVILSPFCIGSSKKCIYYLLEYITKIVKSSRVVSEKIPHTIFSSLRSIRKGKQC